MQAEAAIVGCFLCVLAFLGLLWFGHWLYHWLASIHPSLAFVPLAIGGYSGLRIYDAMKKDNEKKLNETELAAENELWAKIAHEENDDWRDPHW